MEAQFRFLLPIRLTMKQNNQRGYAYTFFQDFTGLKTNPELIHLILGCFSLRMRPILTDLFVCSYGFIIIRDVRAHWVKIS